MLLDTSGERVHASEDWIRAFHHRLRAANMVTAGRECVLKRSKARADNRQSQYERNQAQELPDLRRSEAEFTADMFDRWLWGAS